MLVYVCFSVRNVLYLNRKGVKGLLECYKKMYAILCSAASEAIAGLQEEKDRAYVASIIQKALWDAEERYICESKDEES